MVRKHVCRSMLTVMLFFNVYRTCCKKDAWIKCGVFGISRAVEKFGFERYKRNVGKVCCM